MIVEFIYDRKELQAEPQEITTLIEGELEERRFPLNIKILSVTLMSRWLILLVDFQELTTHNAFTEFLWDALAGLVVLHYNVRFLHWEVHGEGRSLIFKKDWTLDEGAAP